MNWIYGAAPEAELKADREPLPLIPTAVVLALVFVAVLSIAIAFINTIS